MQQGLATMKLSEIKNINEIIQKNKYLFLSFSICESPSFFNSVKLLPHSILYNDDVRKHLLEKKPGLYNFFVDGDYFVKSKAGQYLLYLDPIHSTVMRLVKQRKDLRILYVTNDRDDFDVLYKLISEANITNLELILYKDGRSYGVDNGVEETLPPPKEFEEEAGTIKFIFNTDFKEDIKELRVTFRDTIKSLPTSKVYLSVKDSRSQAVKDPGGKTFSYEVSLKGVRDFKYLTFAAKLDKIYYSENGILFDPTLENQVITLFIEDGVIISRKTSIFEAHNLQTAPRKKVAPTKDEIFPYFGGKKLSSKMKDDLESGSFIDPHPVQQGDSFYLSSRKTIRLGEKIHGGGEGHIYQTNYPGILAKIFTKPKPLFDIEKYRYLVKNKINNPYIIWPEDLILNGNQVIGYTMKEVKGAVNLMEFVQTGQGPKRSTQKFKTYNEIKRLDLVNIIINLLTHIAYLHDRNIILVDLKPANFMYREKTNEVFLIDIDGYQVGEFIATATTPGYVAPEILKDARLMRTTYYDREFDNYAIFVLLFYLLTKITPFLQSERETIITGDFRFAKGDASVRESNRSQALQWIYLPFYIREKFISVGDKKGANFKHGTRIDVYEWLSVFEVYKKDLESGRIRAIGPNLELTSCPKEEFITNYEANFDFYAKELNKLTLISVIEETVKGFNLLNIINGPLDKINLNQSSKTKVISDVRNNGVYDSEELYIKLLKNIGVYFEVNYKYRG